MRESLKKAEDAVARAEGAALVALLAAMVCLAFAQVVLRRFDLGLLWGETLLRQLVMWTGFLGAALAAKNEKHFAWEASRLARSEAWKPRLRMVSSLAGAAVCALLLRAALRYVADERAAGGVLLTVGPASIPSWIASSGMPGGFALLLLHLLFKAADAAFDAMGPRP